MNNNTFLTFSQHYRILMAMLRPATSYKLFEYLFDEYLYRTRTGQDERIPLKRKQFARNSGVSYNSIDASLELLDKMGLIEIYDSYIKISAARLVGLLKAFANLSCSEDEKRKSPRDRFAAALQNGDYKELQQLGYAGPDDNYNFDDLSGGINFYTPTVSTLTPLRAPSIDAIKIYVAIIRQNYRKRSFINEFEDILDGWGINFDTLDEYYGINFDTPNNNRGIKVDDKSKKNIKVDTPTDKKNINFDTRELCDVIFDEFDENYFQKRPFLINILAILGVSTLMSRGINFDTKGVSTLIPSNKYIINKIKEKPQIFDLRQKGKEFFEEENKFYQEEEQETSSFENFEEGQEPDDKLPELDLNLMAERNAQQYKKIKHKQNLPFLPEEDVRRWASDIRECLDRPDKLFLHYLYEIGHRIFDTEEVTDDEGNIITEHNTSIDKWQCYDVRVIPDLLTPAMDSLMEAVEAGKVVVDDEELPVEINEEDVDPSFVELLIDWDKIPSSLNEGGYLYVITPDKYKNIYAEEVPVVKKERNFEERKKKIDDNNAYLHKLILLAQWEDTYEQLTCLEKTVFNFADTFFQLDDNTLKPVDIKKQSEMSQFRHTALKNSLQRFKMEKLEKPLTWEDFTSIFYGTKIDQNECLYLETRMFDADLIRRYHALHNLHSVVDEQNLDELVEDYTEVEA